MSTHECMNKIVLHKTRKTIRLINDPLYSTPSKSHNYNLLMHALIVNISSDVIICIIHIRATQYKVIPILYPNSVTQHSTSCYMFTFVFDMGPFCLYSSRRWSGGRNQDNCGGCEKGGVKSFVHSAPAVPPLSPRHLCHVPSPVPGTVSGHPPETPGTSSSPAPGANGSPACMLATGRRASENSNPTWRLVAFRCTNYRGVVKRLGFSNISWKNKCNNTLLQLKF